jgi:hypothetical protein
MVVSRMTARNKVEENGDMKTDTIKRTVLRIGLRIRRTLLPTVFGWFLLGCPSGLGSTVWLEPDVGGKLKLESTNYIPTGYPYTNNAAYAIEAGTIIELRAQADPGYVVDKWYYNGVDIGVPSGDVDDAITVTGDTIVRVSFKPVNAAAKITLQPDVGGKLKLEGINYVPTGYPFSVNVSYWVATGNIVELRAQADPGYVVDKWYYNGVDIGVPSGDVDDAITVTGDTVVRVRFAPKLQILTAVELQFMTETNRQYQIQKTEDWNNWSNDGPVILGTGATYSVFRSTQNTSQAFYRLMMLGD